MKRNNGGYVLVYVVVVIVILCILVPAACSNSLQNLKAQQASIERMQQLYAAEGQIEQFVAEVEATKEDGESGSSSYADSQLAEAKAKGAVESAVKSEMDTVLNSINNISRADVLEWNWENKNPTCKLSLTSKASNANIVIYADIIVNVTVAIKTPTTTVNGTDYYKWSYEITDCTITYESYAISATTEGKGEDQP